MLHKHFKSQLLLQYSKELKKTTELVFIALLHTAREVDIYSRFDLHIYLYALFIHFDFQLLFFSETN